MLVIVGTGNTFDDAFLFVESDIVGEDDACIVQIVSLASEDRTNQGHGLLVGCEVLVDSILAVFLAIDDEVITLRSMDALLVTHGLRERETIAGYDSAEPIIFLVFLLYGFHHLGTIVIDFEVITR